MSQDRNESARGTPDNRVINQARIEQREIVWKRMARKGARRRERRRGDAVEREGMDGFQELNFEVFPSPPWKSESALGLQGCVGGLARARAGNAVYSRQGLKHPLHAPQTRCR